MSIAWILCGNVESYISKMSVVLSKIIYFSFFINYINMYMGVDCKNVLIKTSDPNKDTFIIKELRITFNAKQNKFLTITWFDLNLLQSI